MNEISGAALLLESSYHEAGHVVLCLTGADAKLDFARASSGGKGTSRLSNAADLTPHRAAQIALAGRVSEEEFLGYPARDVPDNDGYLLRPALAALAGTCDEEQARTATRAVLRRHAAAVTSVARVLRRHADEDVPSSILRGAMGDADMFEANRTEDKHA